MKTDKDGFLLLVFRSRLEQKIPVTQYLLYCICVLFFMAKSILRMGWVKFPHSPTLL